MTHCPPIFVQWFKEARQAAARKDYQHLYRIARRMHSPDAIKMMSRVPHKRRKDG